MRGRKMGLIIIRDYNIYYDRYSFHKESLLCAIRKALKSGYNLKEYFLDEIKKKLIIVKRPVGRPAKEGK